MSSKPVRRSQAISPFGVGAIVNFQGPVSLIHAGLDAWSFDENNHDHFEFRIADDKRLLDQLRVDYLVEPPDFRRRQRNREDQQPNTDLTLPFLRFPLWHVCPRCSRMYLAKAHDFQPPECEGPIGTGKQKGEKHHKKRTIPVRFITACEDGHMQDFPWVEWLVAQNKDAVSSEWRPNDREIYLRMQTTDSLSVSGLRISAEEYNPHAKTIKEVIKKTSMFGVFTQDTEKGFFLSRLGINCSSNNPAVPLRRDGARQIHSNACARPLRVILTGATNLYFPIVGSSIYIPEISKQTRDQNILDLLDDHSVSSRFEDQMIASEDGLINSKNVRSTLRRLRPELVLDVDQLVSVVNEILPERVFFSEARVLTFVKAKIQASRERELNGKIVESVLRKYFPDWEISRDYLLSVLKDSDRLSDLLASDKGRVKDGDDDVGVMSGDYRRQEYNVFCKDISEGRMPRANLLIRSQEISEYSPTVSGFSDRISLLHKMRETRVFMGFSRIYPPENNPRVRWELIASERKRWLPATVVRGEGIFIKFRENLVKEWMGEYGSYHGRRLYTVNKNSNQFREDRNQEADIKTPAFVLLHTFAHLLINELVYECGYGSSSLRERIYSHDDQSNWMGGVLIYTAAGDSEGSMGGLVEMGRPGKLERVIEAALERARWCSSDPVCIESVGQGPGSCNLAACHSCALLPETACEHMNRFLDRGMLIGTLDNPSSGFF